MAEKRRPFSRGREAVDLLLGVAETGGDIFDTLDEVRHLHDLELLSERFTPSD